MNTKNNMEKTNNLLNLLIKLYRKTLQDNVIDKTQSESLCNNFTKYVDETKNESFIINMNKKRKLNFLVIINQNFNLELKKLKTVFVHIFDCSDLL